MESKRTASDTVKFQSQVDFEVKQSGDAVFIEGFANKATIDRGNDIISTDAWDLENFKKNPVILYNHGLDPVFGGTPVGKATQITPTDEGLHIKVRLSNSKSPLITMVRDLVEEKILRAFSVGFDAKDSDVKEDGVREIKSAELYEVSVVGIPMNQDSLFELSGKMLKNKTLDQVERLVCHRKGALVASAIHQSLAAHVKDDSGFDRKQALEDIAEKAGVDLDQLRSILAGDVTPVPEAVLSAVSEILGISLEELKQLELSETKENGSEEDSGEEEDDDKKEKGEVEGGVKEKIPKLLAEGMSQEQAVAAAFSACQEEGKEAPTPEELADALAFADDLLAKQADQEEVDSPTVPIQTARAEDDFGSPYLEAQKQTNVLLGSLINQIQIMSDKLDNVISQDAQESSETAEELGSEELSSGNTSDVETLGDTVSDDSESDDDDKREKSLLDSYKKRLENIELRLRSYE